MRITMLHNPDAGPGNLTADRLRALLAGEGHAFTYLPAKETDLPSTLAAEAALVVVAGGDGTIAKVMTARPGGDVPLALLPSGTANNIARSLGIRGSPEALVRTWATARFRRIDIGSVRGPWGSRRFVEGIGIGGVACAMARIDALEVETGSRLDAAREEVCRVLAEARPMSLELAVDGAPLPAKEPLFVEVMNFGQIGPHLALAPAADPGDGRFDVVWLEASGREAFLRWLREAPGSGQRPPLRSMLGRSVSFAWRGEALRLDDDFPDRPGGGVPVSAEVVPGSVLIQVPGTDDSAADGPTERMEHEGP